MPCSPGARSTSPCRAWPARSSRAAASSPQPDSSPPLFSYRPTRVRAQLTSDLKEENRMSTEAIVVLAVVVVVLVALVALIARRRRLDSRRTQAGELREEAQARGWKADRREAEAEQQEARAKRGRAEAEEKAAVSKGEEAAAEERSQVAHRERHFARSRADEAREVDPDSTDEHEAATADSGGTRDRPREEQRGAFVAGAPRPPPHVAG